MCFHNFVSPNVGLFLLHFYTNNQFYFKWFSLAWVHSLPKTFLFQAIQFSQTVLIQPSPFSMSIDFFNTQLNVKTVLFFKKSV